MTDFSNSYEKEDRDFLLSEAENEIRTFFKKISIPLDIQSYIGTLKLGTDDRYSGSLIINGKPAVYDEQAVRKRIDNLSKKLVIHCGGQAL